MFKFLEENKWSIIWAVGAVFWLLMAITIPVTKPIDLISVGAFMILFCISIVLSAVCDN